METNLSLTGDSYKLDIGNTPTGGEFTRMVGGVEWMPKLSHNSSLDLKAERRAVTDSLLSYVGAKDKTTGESWGAVTRNGVSAQYAWDNDLVAAICACSAPQKANSRWASTSITWTLTAT